MKRILLHALLIAGLCGCKNTGDRAKGTTGISPLSFTTKNFSNIEPIALVKSGSYYHLFYSGSDGEKTDKRNSIKQSISEDLINWSESTILNFPTTNNSNFFATIIIDSSNHTPFGTKNKPALVAVLTKVEAADSTRPEKRKAIPTLVYSTDDGNSWKEANDKITFPPAFTSNPQRIGICWHQVTKKWIMTLTLNDHVEFYSSADLRSWNYESSLGSDFFPENVKWGHTTLFLASGGVHWVLLADIKKNGTQTSGGTAYFIGSFDGHKFTNQSSQLHWLDYGDDMYGSLVSVGDAGRIVNVGWRNRGGEQPAKSKDAERIVTIPRELAIENTDLESFISASPVREFKKIYGKEVTLAPVKVSYKVEDAELSPDLKTPAELFLVFNTSDIQKGSFPTRFGLSLSNDLGEHITFGFDRFGYYYLDKSGLAINGGNKTINEPVKMPFVHSDSTMTIRLIIDNSTIECFAEGGKLVMTTAYSSKEPFNKIKLFAIKGNIDFTGGKMTELKPVKR